MPVAARLLLPALMVSATTLALHQDENSVCGHIESGQLTVPSYRFSITGTDGRPATTLTGGGTLEIVEGVWRGSWFEGYWDQSHHDMPIPVSFDASQDLYVSDALPRVTIAHRKKGFALFSANCWDRVTRLTFSFATAPAAPDAGPREHASFVFTVPNRKVQDVRLPDPAVVIQLRSGR
jgi:hypothetical protein